MSDNFKLNNELDVLNKHLLYLTNNQNKVYQNLFEFILPNLPSLNGKTSSLSYSPKIKAKNLLNILNTLKAELNKKKSVEQFEEKSTSEILLELKLSANEKIELIDEKEKIEDEIFLIKQETEKYLTTYGCNVSGVDLTTTLNNNNNSSSVVVSNNSDNTRLKRAKEKDKKITELKTNLLHLEKAIQDAKVLYDDKLVKSNFYLNENDVSIQCKF